MSNAQIEFALANVPSNIIYLKLSRNFTGGVTGTYYPKIDQPHIPSTVLKKLGRLSEVGYVLLSGHGFRGVIPKEVQKMTSVNHLDLR